MAESTSEIRAQVQKLCGLCKEEPRIKWRCIDCDKCLCDRCKDIHLKLKMSKDHKLIDIRIPLQDVKPPLETIRNEILCDNIFCQQHETERCRFFCVTCLKPLCQKCVSEIHKQHEIEPIEKGIQIATANLTTKDFQIGQNLGRCTERVMQVENKEFDYKTFCNTIIARIKTKEDELNKSISEYSSSLQEEVEVKKRIMLRETADLKHKEVSRKLMFENQKKKIRKALKSNQANVIFQTASINISLVESALADINFEHISRVFKDVSYINGKDHINLPKIFGSIPTTGIEYLKPDIDIKILKQYSTDLPFIDKVMTLSDQSMWISNSKNEILRRIKIENENIVNIREISVRIADMALTSKNNILVTLYDSSEIQMLKPSGEMKSFLSVTPLLPRGIHVTRDHDIIIGVKEPGNRYTPSSKSIRAIKIFGRDGRHKQTFQYNKTKRTFLCPFSSKRRRLFTTPSQITTNIKNDILVIDEVSAHMGRIVALQTDGKVKWTYEGNPLINVSKDFDPWALVTTSDALQSPICLKLPIFV